MAKWNLNHIYDFNKTDSMIKELHEKVAEFEKYRKKLNASLTPSSFMEILKKKEDIVLIAAKLAGYASLWLSENTADSDRNAHEAKIGELLADLGNKQLFFNLWFKELTDKQAEKYIKAAGKYAYFLKRIRDFKEYTLSEKEEQIINLKNLTGNEALVRMYDIITNRFRYSWDGKQVQQAELVKYFTSPDSKKREKAYNLMLEKYEQEEPVISEIYKGISNDWRNEHVKLRKYDDPIAVRNLSNDVPPKAIDVLLTVVQNNRTLFQEYAKLKGKLLNIKPMSRYHLYAPYDAKEKTYSYETSKSLVLETYKDFSDQAYTMAKQIFDEGHVHSDLVENKQSGAFCSTVLNTITPFVLLNHVDRLRDIFTMAHELGHGIHSLAAKDQTPFTFHAGLPLAETASVFGEMLLSEKMLKTANKEERISLLMHRLDDQYATICRQTYFVLFEKEAHELIAKGATVDILNKAYYANLKNQFGDALEVPKQFMHEWKYIPHIFHTPFYCYAYSFGNLLVLALYAQYQKEGNAFVPKYFKILSAGGSKEPSKILKDVGIDITQESFWQQGFDLIKKELDELKTLIP